MGDEQAAVAGTAGDVPGGVAPDAAGGGGQDDGGERAGVELDLHLGWGSTPVPFEAEVVFTTVTRNGRVIQLPLHQPPDKRRPVIRKTTQKRLTKLLTLKAEAEEWFLRFPETRGIHWFKYPCRSVENVRALIAQRGLFSPYDGWVVVARGNAALWITRESEQGTWVVDGRVCTRGKNNSHANAGPRPQSLREKLDMMADLLDLEDDE